MNKVSQQDIRLMIDVGVELDDNNLGSNDLWVKINEALDDMAEQMGLKEVSAGTGFGVRDMQFTTDPERDPNGIALGVTEYLVALGYTVQYVGTYYCDTQGFEVLRDGTMVDEEEI